MQHWLLKSEPSTHSWDDFLKERRTAWTGVRNFQARKYLAAMAKGDHAFFYHSGAGKEIVGVAQIVKAAYADPTDDEGTWVCVDLKPLHALVKPVTLSQIKEDKAFADFLLVRHSRLSVVPVSSREARRILQLGERRAPSK